MSFKILRDGSKFFVEVEGETHDIKKGLKKLKKLADKRR